MSKITLTIFAAFVALPMHASATVTWTFYETSCSIFSSGAPCQTNFPVTFPYPIGSLTLSGPTSSGSASWMNNSGIGPFVPPVLTGDPDFSVVFATVQPIAPPTYGTNDIMCHAAPAAICQYDITWSETNGNLDDVSIFIEAGAADIGGTFINGKPFGLTGGIIATDGIIDNCDDSQCQIGGFWQSNLAVPEPMSASLLAIGLFSFALATGPARALRNQLRR
jgi:hypothetical protein